MNYACLPSLPLVVGGEYGRTQPGFFINALCPWAPNSVPRALQQTHECVTSYFKTCKVNTGTFARCHAVELFGPNYLLMEPSGVPLSLGALQSITETLGAP